MIYKRILIRPHYEYFGNGNSLFADRQPLYTVFAYLAYRGGNSIQYGLGYESRDELQRVHVATGIAHLQWYWWFKQRIETQGVPLKTGKLREFFGDHEMMILVQKHLQAPRSSLDFFKATDTEFTRDPYIHCGLDFLKGFSEIVGEQDAAEQEAVTSRAEAKKARHEAWLQAQEGIKAEAAEREVYLAAGGTEDGWTQIKTDRERVDFITSLDTESAEIESQNSQTESQICPKS